MRARTGVVITLVMLVAATAFVVVALEKNKSRLRLRLAGLRQQQTEIVRLREANQSAHLRRMRVTLDQTAVANQLRAEVEQIRADIAALERRAELARAEKLAQATALAASDAASLAGNRDPTKGLARLEFFENQGFATPEAAFQTLVWAAMDGDEATLTTGLLLTEAGRQRAEMLLAAEPGDVRLETPPERLAALSFMRSLLDVSAAAILEVTRHDADQATLRVRGGIGTDGRIDMRWAEGGWKIILPERSIEVLQKKLGQP